MSETVRKREWFWVDDELLQDTELSRKPSSLPLNPIRVSELLLPTHLHLSILEATCETIARESYCTQTKHPLERLITVQLIDTQICFFFFLDWVGLPNLPL